MKMDCPSIKKQQQFQWFNNQKHNCCYSPDIATIFSRSCWSPAPNFVFAKNNKEKFSLRTLNYSSKLKCRGDSSTGSIKAQERKELYIFSFLTFGSWNKRT